jgi:hypothetical protein
MRAFALSLLVLATPRPAHACGGFFCNATPVLQARERLLFLLDPDAHVVEMHVQVTWSGPPEAFSWILPVPALPDVSVGSQALFPMLNPVGAPSRSVAWQNDGTCAKDRFDRPAPERSWPITREPVPSGAGGGGGGGGGVAVYSSQEIGPYEATTLQADSAEALIAWLTANDYTTPPDLDNAVRPYLGGGAFVALKLRSEATVGELVPLRVRYPGTVGTIPVVLTALSSVPDLPMEVFVLSPSQRAVSPNYLHAVVNEAGLDWFSGDTLIAEYPAAINEAGGQAFITEFAGPAGLPAGALSAGTAFDGDTLRALTDPIAYAAALPLQGFRGGATLLGLWREHLPMPAALRWAGVSEATFYACLSCYPRWVERIPFDPAAMTDDLYARLVEPAASLDAAFARLPYLTRLYTTMSPAEMTVDPLIALNPDLPEVLARQEAEGQMNCQHRSWTDSMQWVTLPNGTMIAGAPGLSAIADDIGLPDVPAALRVEQLGVAGPPLVVVDNTAATLAAVDAHNEAVFAVWRSNGMIPPGADDPLPDQAPPEVEPVEEPQADSPSSAPARGCATPPAASAVAVLAALAALRRRRA